MIKEFKFKKEEFVICKNEYYLDLEGIIVERERDADTGCNFYSVLFNTGLTGLKGYFREDDLIKK